MSSENKQKELAIALHKTFCPYNYVDQCGWYQEQEGINPWGGTSHRMWFGMAKYVLRSLTYTPEKMLAAFEIVDNIRSVIANKE